jgi:hypothetical protein
MKNARMYGLFFRNRQGRWVRLYPRLAFRKPAAVRFFQSLLIGLSIRGKCPALRPVKI